MISKHCFATSSTKYLCSRGWRGTIVSIQRCGFSSDNEVELDGPPRIPLRGYYDVKSWNKRRQWVEKFTSAKLTHLGEWWDNEGSDISCSTAKLKGNAENVIGLAKVPVGVVGPLLIHGDHVNGHVLCPFSTTEGALIASTTRGATALSKAGPCGQTTNDPSSGVCHGKHPWNVNCLGVVKGQPTVLKATGS